MLNIDLEIDARGLNCPLPILRTRKGINTLASGQVVKIIATDPGSVKDLEAFCKQTGNEMLESSQQNGEYHFNIRKG
ncbi:MAG: sulfurtransferase TusA family protein [Thiogranum sp.]|jgi:tRNA 2-thiouridine synthesizing protein A